MFMLNFGTSVYNDTKVKEMNEMHSKRILSV